MGKKSRNSKGGEAPAPGLADEADIQALVDKASELKTEANTMFAKKEFTKALELYQQAASSYPHDHSEKSAMLCNKAACYTMLKKPKEAAKECTNALAIAPGNPKALLWRSKALEVQGLYKQALSDVQALNKSADASTDSQNSEQRLKDIMSGKTKPQPIQGTRPAAKPALAGRQQQQQQQQLPHFTAKCTFGDDTRVIYLNYNTTYQELLNQIKAKFPNCGNVLVKHKDKDGDLVTITSRQDIYNAMAESVQALERRGNVGGANLPPPIRLTIVKANDQAEEVFELDDWLIDFANLFREHLGIRPDRHVDLHNEGWEKCTQALDAAVQDDKAGPLFDQAAQRFAEVTASGLYHWGNVHMCIARKTIDSITAANKTVDDVAPQVREEFDKAEVKYQESLGFKADFYDGAVGMGQLFFERAKLNIGLLLPTPTPEEGKDAQEASNQMTKDALMKVTPDMAKQADELFKKSIDCFKSAITMLPDEDAAAAEAAPKPEADAAEAELSFRAQAQVMWGNVLYEQSQVSAAIGQGDWKPLVDEAVKKFNEAGCQQADIRTALLNHLKASEIDIPPEPEQEKPAAPAVEAAPAAEAAPEKEAPAEEAPKGGLMALGPQKKNAKKNGKADK